MLTIDVRGIKEIKSLLKLPKIVASCLNTTAYKVTQREREEIKKVFDRPTPFIARSPRYQKATETTLIASVYIPPEGEKTLLAEVEGGPRKIKDYENMLRSSGVLPAGRLLVPGGGAKLDRYGNIDMDQLASVFKSVGLVSKTNNTKKRKKALAQSDSYFVAKGFDHLPQGVWKRLPRNHVTPILLFISKTEYKSRLNFYNVARNRALTVMGEEFVKKMNKLNLGG
jgi:hypothetical protein